MDREIELITSPLNGSLILSPAGHGTIVQFTSTCSACHLALDRILPCCSSKSGQCATCQSQTDPDQPAVVVCLTCGLRYNSHDLSVVGSVPAAKSISSSDLNVKKMLAPKAKHDDVLSPKKAFDNKGQHGGASTVDSDNLSEVDYLKDRNHLLRETVGCLTREKQCLVNSLLRRENVIATLTQKLQGSGRSAENSSLKEKCEILLEERHQLYQQISESVDSSKAIEDLKFQIDEKNLEIRSLREEMSTYRAKSPVIGIDIGTTKSSVAVIGSNGQPQIIATISSSLNLADSILSDADGSENGEPINVVSGIRRLLTLSFDDAAKQAKRLSRQFSVHPTSRIGQQTEISVPCRRGEKFTPLELYAALLMKLKRLAEAHFDNQQPINEAVVVVPAVFGDRQRQAVLDAAAVAGLNVTHLISETGAIFNAFEKQLRPKSSSILVVSMGSGFTEASCFEKDLTTGCYEMVSSQAAPTGGEDIDSLLMQTCRSEWKQWLADVDTEKEILAQMKQKCQMAKHELSAQGVKQVEIQVQLRNNLILGVTIPKSRFDSFMNGYVLPEFKKLVSKATEGRNPDEIVLAGGSMQIQLLAHSVHSLFPMAKLNSTFAKVESSAALGAAFVRHSPPRREVMPVEIDCFLKHAESDKKGHCWRISENVALPSSVKFAHAWPADCFDSTASNFTVSVRQNKQHLGSARFKDGKPDDVEVTLEIDENGVVADFEIEHFGRPDSAITIEKDHDGLTKNQIRRLRQQLERLQENARLPIAEDESQLKLDKLIAFAEVQTFVTTASAPIG